MRTFIASLCLLVAIASPCQQLIDPYRFGAPLLLNSTTNIAFSAYSVARKLSGSYAGAAFRVIRASDLAQQDIGFTSGNVVDQSALTTFVGTTNGLVRTIYDQSGNSRHLTNAIVINQPLIVQTNGVVFVDDNGHPRAEFDGTDDVLIMTSGPGSLPITYFATVSSDTHTGNDIMVSGTSGSNALTLKQDVGAQEFCVNNGLQPGTDYPDYVLTQQYLMTIYCESGSSDSIQQNNVTKTTGSFGDNTAPELRVGNLTLCADYNFSEWILYAEAVTGNDLTTLQSNINAFYTLW